MYVAWPCALSLVPWSWCSHSPRTVPDFIGIALPPKLSWPSPSMTKPPPVTQQPPAPGGWQSSPLAVLWSGTHAPHCDGCVPGRHFGGLRHVTLPFTSVSHVQPPPLPPPLPPPEPDAPPLDDGP